MSVIEVLAKVLQINVTEFTFPLVVGATLLAGISDARSYKVPNSITIPLICVGVAYHAASIYGNGLLFSLAGFSFGLFILLPFFVLGGIGAGDVKLLAGIGACLGLHDTMAIFLVFGTLTSAYSAIVLVVRGRSRSYRAIAVPSAEGGRIENALERDPETRRWRVVPLATIMAFALLILTMAQIAPQMFT